MLIDRRDTPANPSHDGNRHGIADGLVARPIGTFLGGLALPSDKRMPIGETLEAFALERGETTHEHGISPNILISDLRGNHRAIATAFESRADIAADSRMRIEVAHGDRVAPAAGCDHVRMVRKRPAEVPSPTMRTSLRTFCANPNGGRELFSRAQTAGPDEVSRVGKTSDMPTPKPLLLEWAVSQTYV